MRQNRYNTNRFGSLGLSDNCRHACRQLLTSLSAIVNEFVDNCRSIENSQLLK
jgi:hypothetical protein